MKNSEAIKIITNTLKDELEGNKRLLSINELSKQTRISKKKILELALSVEFSEIRDCANFLIRDLVVVLFTQAKKGDLKAIELFFKYFVPDTNSQHVDLTVDEYIQLPDINDN